MKSQADRKHPRFGREHATTMWLTRFALGIFALVFATASSARGARFIVEDGMPRAEIVIDVQPPRTVRMAAWELQNYVRKISGATLPIVHEPGTAAVQVYVGASEHTARLGVGNAGLDDGAYRIVSGEKWLVLIGTDTDFQPVEPYARTRSERGSDAIIAAWDAIAPGKWSVPNGNAFKMLFRNIDRAFREEDADESMDLWAFDERGSYNAVCGFLRHLGVRWYMPGELGEVVPSLASIPLPEIDERAVPAFSVRDCNVAIGIHDPRLAIWAMRLGMRQPHGFGWAHGLNGVTSREEMKQAHPEYYALLKGARATGFRSGGKQCLSSPGLFDETVRYARTLFDHYDHEVISLQPADGYTALCQCGLCVGKDSPHRPPRGTMSDYVWGFTVRVADEIAKSHPGRMVQNMAYNNALLPPENIEEVPDNVLVCVIGARRPTRVDPVQRQEIRELREAWKKKTHQKLVNFENYPLTARGYWLPAFTARLNAESINAIKGDFLGENIQPSAHRFMDAAAFNSYQFYFTFRMYWGDEHQDIDPMLEEFYTLFYGPARSQMKAFYEYCGEHFAEMDKDKSKADRALALFAEAREQVEAGSVYDQRLALMGEYLASLDARSQQMAKEAERENAPQMRMWRNVDITLDGRLDDDYWATVPKWAGNRLRDVQTGAKPAFGTTFQVAWNGGGIYFAIRCQENPGEAPRTGTDRDDDPAIWDGDYVEILIETEQHSYYQIAISPAGAVFDGDRSGNEQSALRWASQAEVKTHIGDGEWTIEARIPVMDSSSDPFHQVVGRRPLSSLPWYFNVCRQRIRDGERELSAFSPTGEQNFHVPDRFGKLFYK